MTWLESRGDNLNLKQAFQDLRFTARALRRSPGFSASVVILLTVAIWMNTTVFTVIHAVMLAPLPFDHPEELVRLHEDNPRKGAVDSGVAPANFVDWRASSRAFSEFAFVQRYRCAIFDGDGEPEQVQAALITDGFFGVLRVRPPIGRAFLAKEYSPMSRSGLPVMQSMSAVIISHRLWLNRFGGRPEAVGETLHIGDESRRAALRIVGVMPADFDSVNTSLGPSDLWLPLSMIEGSVPVGRAYGMVIARRRPEFSLRQTRAEMDVIAQRLHSKRPDSNAGWAVRVVDLREAVVGGYRASLLVLAAAVALVLLIACTNVANLMLAYGGARRREMATRAALGAGFPRLVAQVARESVFLSLAAGALGFLLALASVRTIVALAPQSLPRVSETSVDVSVFWFCLLVALSTGLLCGAAPALRISRIDLSGALKEGGTQSPGGARGLLSRSLVALEVAVSLVLLVGAALLARGFARIQTFKLGFQPGYVLTASLEPDRERYQTAESVIRFYDELLPRLQRIPGVLAPAVGAVPPGYPTFTSSYYKEGAVERIQCNKSAPSIQYFAALRIPLLKGRLFTEADCAGTPTVVIVNRTAARLSWPREEAVGKRIRLTDSAKRDWTTVVGVVEDVPNQGLRSQPGPQVYLPLSRKMVVDPGRSLVIRTSGNAAALTEAVRAAIRSHDSHTRITSVITLEERLASATAGLRFNTLLMGVFAALAFLLATSGVYSLMSYTVSLRTREMSIRMALGANSDDILRLILRTGAALVGIGVGLGLLGALGAARFLSSLLYQVTPSDPLSFLAATALLVLAALVACYLPAHRAARLDVVRTLRQD